MWNKNAIQLTLLHRNPKFFVEELRHRKELCSAEEKWLVRRYWHSLRIVTLVKNIARATEFIDRFHDCDCWQNVN